jgi:hypothetical protein
MDSPAEYRRYAEECERMAREGLPEHKEVLLAIAKAWRDCAERAESREVPSADGD